MEPRLVDLVRDWLKEDLCLQQHFEVDLPEEGDYTGAGDMWSIGCKCSIMTMAYVWPTHVNFCVPPLQVIEKYREIRDEQTWAMLERGSKFPIWHRIPMEDPQFFELLRYGILAYHKYVKDKSVV